jgi:hypothetical protein
VATVTTIPTALCSIPYNGADSAQLCRNADAESAVNGLKLF